MTDTRRRVKVYALNIERQWDDRGTGHVSSSYIDRKGFSLLVRAESDGSLLLESKIQPDTAYQKQQDTLIVWSEGDNFDLALSFQEKAGCDEIWSKICEVQGKDPSVEITQDIVEESEDERFDEMADADPPVELPPCEISRLEEISDAERVGEDEAGCCHYSTSSYNHQLTQISPQSLLFTHAFTGSNTASALIGYGKSKFNNLLGKSKELAEVFQQQDSTNEVIVGGYLGTPLRKKRLASAIDAEGYIRKLLNLFHMCEDLENMEGLHCLYEIFKNIFLLNMNSLFEVMFSDDLIFDVVGCLEYDPSSPAPKRHRQYLKATAKFKEVIPIANPELLAKIHQTYRVQYIQDVVLPTPSVFEDNMLPTLSSFIFFNKVEIVTLIQEDEKFLNDLFSQLTSESTPELKRRDLILFLKEFCNFSQNLQAQGKESFFKTVSSLGILPALEISLSSDDVQTKTASIDILTSLVEFSPSLVREYTLQQSSTIDEELILLNVIIEQMIYDTDPELGRAVQLMGVLRILIDPENMLASNKPEKTDFLNYFYKHSIHVLIAPLLANTVDNHPAKDDYQTVQLLGLILELLSFCVEHHTYHIKNCILNKDLLRRVLVLMKSNHTFLVLCALRFMRKIIALKDEFYNRYIMKGNLFSPVVDAFIRNNGRYNLLDSAIIEMFEFIKLEDVKTLCAHIVESYGKVLDEVDYVQTFKAMKVRYNHQEKIKEREKTSLDGVPSILRTNRYRRDHRQMEDEEEMWFNEEDDFDDGEAIVAAGEKLSSELESLGKALEKKSEGCSGKLFSGANAKSPIINNNPLSITGASQLSPAQGDIKCAALFKKALVDYDGDSDEEEEEEGSELLSPTKRARFS